jgi:tetratricopeptide (TPR) repeat protein
MDFYFRGMACLTKGYAPEQISKARGFFVRALALDPENVDALVGSATVDMHGGANWTDDRPTYLAAAGRALTKALSLDPRHALAHLYMGQFLVITNRWAEGIEEIEQALILDRNLALAHGYIGFAKIVSGRAEETEAHIQEALRLSPRDATAYLWLAFAGIAKLFLGSDEEAVARFRRSFDTNRNQPSVHLFVFAAALAQLGRVDEAKSVAMSGLALDPAFTIRRFRGNAPTDNPVFLAQRERACTGMRKAGVPEG